ncbi:MAG TPA: hypothetical protein VGL56_20345 [Fimbriimonadaceae bacterium]|jgi:hypothetical protein
MLKQHNEPLPYLREYLAELNIMPTPGAGFIVAGIFLVIAGIISLVLPYGVIGLIELGFFAVACWGVAAFARASHKKKHPRLYTEQHNKAMALARQMIVSKRLHKALDAGSAQLLEESARYWKEIQSNLEGPSWTGPQLPSHWQNVKAQALAATDEAMEEMLLLLQGSFHPFAGPQGLRASVEDAMETFVTGPRFREGDMLPAGFEPARHLAEKLKLLAKQIREATQDISREAIVSPQEDVAAALDMAISDIRNIQSAEIELRNNA